MTRGAGMRLAAITVLHVLTVTVARAVIRHGMVVLLRVGLDRPMHERGGEFKPGHETLKWRECQCDQEDKVQEIRERTPHGGQCYRV